VHSARNHALITTDPSEGSLNDPSLGQNFKPKSCGGAFDNRHHPRTSSGHGFCRFRSLIAAVAIDALDERKHTARAAVEHQRNTVTILDAGSMNDHVQQQAERIDENVPLATLDLLARIKALRVERSPPF
jgi:hypothetical protein